MPKLSRKAIRLLARAVRAGAQVDSSCMSGTDFAALAIAISDQNKRADRFRSAVTGRFVTALFARVFPWITVKERAK
jgi:hypothetical protein